MHCPKCNYPYIDVLTMREVTIHVLPNEDVDVEDIEDPGSWNSGDRAECRNSKCTYKGIVEEFETEEDDLVPNEKCPECGEPTVIVYTQPDNKPLEVCKADCGWERGQ